MTKINNKYLVTVVALAVIFIVFMLAKKSNKNVAHTPSVVTPVVTAMPNKTITERPRLSIDAIKRTDEAQEASQPSTTSAEGKDTVKNTKPQSVKASGSANAVSGSAGSQDEAAEPSAQKDSGIFLPQPDLGGGYKGASSIGGGGSGAAPVNAVPPTDAVAKMIKKENDRSSEYRNAVAAIDAERAANRNELRNEAENPPPAVDTTAGQGSVSDTGGGSTSTPAQGGQQNTGTTPPSAPNTGPSKLAY